MQVINPAAGCHYFPPGLQLPPQPNFAAWWTEAQWVWTVCLRLLPSSIATAIWTQAFCTRVQHANHSATEPPECKVGHLKVECHYNPSTPQSSASVLTAAVCPTQRISTCNDKRQQNETGWTRTKRRSVWMGEKEDREGNWGMAMSLEETGKV